MKKSVWPGRSVASNTFMYHCCISTYCLLMKWMWWYDDRRRVRPAAVTSSTFAPSGPSRYEKRPYRPACRWPPQPPARARVPVR